MIDIFSLTSGIPQSLTKMLCGADKLLAHCNKFNDRFNTLEVSSKKNFRSVPVNATIREERIKCGKSLCVMCPHGPYYYAYWRDDYGKLRKRYVGTRYEEIWKKSVHRKK